MAFTPSLPMVLSTFPGIRIDYRAHGGCCDRSIVLFPFSVPAMIFSIAPFACYFAFALFRGLHFARQRDFTAHRAWMVRAFTIASAIATQRLILVPSLAILDTEAETIRVTSMMLR